MEVRLLVAWNLRLLRVAKGVSQDDLALSAGIERAYVGHLERGSKNPTVETLEKLAIALDCHVSEFFVEPADPDVRPQPLKGGRRKR